MNIETTNIESLHQSSGIAAMCDVSCIFYLSVNQYQLNYFSFFLKIF